MSRINLNLSRKLRQDPTHTYVYLTANHAMARAPMTVIVSDDTVLHTVDLPSDAVGGDLVWVRPGLSNPVDVNAAFGQTIETGSTYTCNPTESYLFVYVDILFDWIRLMHITIP